jgi:zona occludens toxin
MTAAIIHGDPGSYKTSSLVSDYLVPAVKQGRVVVTNIRGVKTPQEIADAFGFELPESADIMLVPFDDQGFDLMARFFHWAPFGAIILMDEGQRVYPTRLRNFDEFDNHQFPDRPSSVENAFDTHRHHNWDIYISTPSISKIHKEIRTVAEFGYRHKNMAALFSFLKGRYKRVTHLADNSGTSLSHALSTNFRKIDERCFDVYQSTATGQHKDTDSKVSLFKQPKILFLLLCIALAVGSLVSNIAAHGVPAMLGGSVSQDPVSNAVAPVSPVRSDAPFRAAAGDVHLGQVDQNPFGNMTIYLQGNFGDQLLFLVEYPDKSTLNFTSDDFLSMGFKLDRYIAGRYAVLFFGSQKIMVFQRPQAVYQVAQVMDKFAAMPDIYKPD